MRVLMISKALITGTYHKKISELLNLGVEVDLVIPEIWGSRRPEITRGDGYGVHVLPVYFGGQNHLHFYRSLDRVVQTVRPDLLHVDEEPYSIVTFQALWLARRAVIPGLFFTWQNIQKRYPVPFSWFERHNYAVASIAISGNQEAKEILRRKGFVKDVFVIPQFGIDPGMYSRRSAAELKARLFSSADVKVVGFVGRLVEEKGLSTLLEAFSGLAANARLLLVGSGPMKPALEKMAERLRIRERVVLVEDVPSQGVPAYLNCLDCLVLPSLTRRNWKEQFGRVLIEAMACEVPVIGSDSGEIPTVIGGAGLIFPEGDAASLREKLHLVFGQEDERRRLAARGRERALTQFTQRRVAEDTVAVYREVLRRSKSMVAARP